MRVLVIDEEIPFPVNSGKRLRTYNLLKHLTKTHEITFMSRSHEGNEMAATAPMHELGMKTVVIDDPVRKKSGLAFYWALLRNLWSAHPYTVTSHSSSAMREKVVEEIEGQQYDLIHCEWTPYGINMEHVFDRLPSVVDAHNVEAIIWKRNFEVEKNVLKKVYIYLQWKKMAWFEKKFFPKFSSVVAVSQQDAEVIEQFCPSVVPAVVSNGVDVEYFSQRQVVTVPKTGENDLVFTGSLDWRPNIDGILYFIHEVMPHYRKSCPQGKFYVIGRNPGPSLKREIDKHENVELVGMVDDIRPYMSKDSTYIVPLRVGGGSRLKILEAFSMEIPVVSTSIGAEGLEIEHGRDIMIADSPTAFIKAIDTIKGDRELANRLTANGKMLVEEKYQWRVLAKDLGNVWNETVKKSGRN